MTLYYYYKHRDALMAVLMRLGCTKKTTPIRAVDDAHQLNGLRGELFFNDYNSPHRLPAELRDKLRVMGWEILEYDDTAHRERYQREKRK